MVEIWLSRPSWMLTADRLLVILLRLTVGSHCSLIHNWLTLGLQGSRAPGNFVVEQRKSTDQAASEQAMGTFRLHTKQYCSWEIRVRVDIILESFIHIPTSNLRTYKEHHIQVRWEWGCYFSLEIWGVRVFLLSNSGLWSCVCVCLLQVVMLWVTGGLGRNGWYCLR